MATVISFPMTISDHSGNSFTAKAGQNDGTEEYVWFYCLSALADASETITVAFTGSPASFGGLATWVVPVTGAAVFDVLSTLKSMSGSGDQLTNTFVTAGADEIGFCALFDRNGNAGWTAVSPAVVDSASFASSRSAADHETWSSAQASATIGLSNANIPLGGIQAIAFMAGNIAVNVTASDTESFSEMLTRLTSVSRPVADTESFSETLAQIRAIHVSASDSFSFSELLARVTGIFRALVDSFSFSDSPSFSEDFSVPIFGFSPNYYFNQESAGLSVYISPGIINGIPFNGQIVNVPANQTTTVSLNQNGQAVIGSGKHLYPLATVVTGQVVTSGSTGRNANTSNGILSIADIRPGSRFAF